MLIVSPKPKKRRRKFTDRQRRALAKAIRRVKPWAKSTGPRTFEGKIISRQNGLKHGLYTWMFAAETRRYAQLLRSLRSSRTE